MCNNINYNSWEIGYYACKGTRRERVVVKLFDVHVIWVRGLNQIELAVVVGFVRG